MLSWCFSSCSTHSHIQICRCVRFFLCVPHPRFCECESFFLQRSICEFARKPSFRAVPRTSRQAQYHIPPLCQQNLFIIFLALPSKKHAMCKQANVDTHTSKSHAKQIPAMQRTIAPVSTSARKRGKTRQIGIFVETEKYDQ